MLCIHLYIKKFGKKKKKKDLKIKKIDCLRINRSIFFCEPYKIKFLNMRTLYNIKNNKKTLTDGNRRSDEKRPPRICDNFHMKIRQKIGENGVFFDVFGVFFDVFGRKMNPGDVFLH
jgi:hypothetical protein